MLFRQLNSLFNRRERWQLAILSVALVIRAGVEMVGVSSIAPFMSVVADPAVIGRNEYLRWLYDSLGFTSTTGFLTGLGLAVVGVLAVANTFSAVALWAMLRFSWGMHHRLSCRLFRGYLAQPYSFFVQTNSAALNKTILSEVQQVIQGVLIPVLNILARLLVVLALVGLLMVLDPLLALVIVVVMGGAYGGIYLAVRLRQQRLGRARVQANQLRYKIAGEAFGGIKDVKVLHREGSFAVRFAPPSWTYSKATASNAAVAQLPRYLLETIAFGGIILIVLYYLQAGRGIAQILPTLSLYAFAGYRLMPELQTMFAGVASIRFNHAALDNLTEDLARFQKGGLAPSPRCLSPFLSATEALHFSDSIRFESVTFTYPGAHVPALDNVSLTIPRNQTIGLVGASGAGKTTVVDLLLGLYLPDSGQILIDDVPLTPTTIPAWRRQIGYVPQHIFLSGDSVTANIAFGVPMAEIDPSRVEHAARIAHLHDFIQSLPHVYETLVGERGVRLSGGQRQRIGIARALYHDPSVLVFDEATSALDGATEAAVMEAIHELAGKKTIVLIAHRLTTVESSDAIYLFDCARVEGSGIYAELAAGSTLFQSMANRNPELSNV